MRYATTLALLGITSVCLAEEKAEPEPVTVEVKSWAEVTKLAEGTKGKVVVVDLWSTWCDECRREFPNLVALQAKYPKRVTCISVSLDFAGVEKKADALKPQVLEALEKFGARDTRNVICADPDETIYDKLDLGSVPAALVYDRTGKLRKRFDNDNGEYGDDGFTYEKHVEPLVRELIGTE